MCFRQQRRGGISCVKGSFKGAFWFLFPVFKFLIYSTEQQNTPQQQAKHHIVAVTAGKINTIWTKGGKIAGMQKSGYRVEKFTLPRLMVWHMCEALFLWTAFLVQGGLQDRGLLQYSCACLFNHICRGLQAAAGDSHAVRTGLSSSHGTPCSMLWSQPHRHASILLNRSPSQCSNLSVNPQPAPSSALTPPSLRLSAGFHSMSSL